MKNSGVSCSSSDVTSQLALAVRGSDAYYRGRVFDSNFFHFDFSARALSYPWRLVKNVDTTGRQIIRHMFKTTNHLMSCCPEEVAEEQKLGFMSRRGLEVSTEFHHAAAELPQTRENKKILRQNPIRR